MRLFYWLKKLPRKNLYYCFLTVIIGVGVISGMAWKTYSQSKSAVTVEDTPLVRTTVIGSVDGKQKYTYSGEVRGRYESKLAFQVSGKIVKRNIQLGSQVHAGDILMQIDPKDLQQNVNNTSAQVSSAESQMRLAESNLNRYQQLYADKVISRAQLDQYENAYEVAQAAVQQASAQHAQSSNQLDYSLLYADTSGVISDISVEAGQVVSAGQSVLTIVRDGEREVEINVPENRIEEIRNVKQVAVTFWSLPQIVVNGIVREIAPMADVATRTYKVRISLSNPPDQVKLGMTAEVSLNGVSNQNQASIMIPLSALYQTNKITNVWVVNDQVVSLRSVQIGNFGNGQVQVTGGLNPGETIVIAGVHKLQEGQMVKLMEGDAQ